MQAHNQGGATDKLPPPMFWKHFESAKNFSIILTPESISQLGTWSNVRIKRFFSIKFLETFAYVVQR